MTNEPPDPMTSMWAWIAYQLRYQRIERSLTGDAVAKLLNCSRATISRLETGEARLQDKQAAKLDKEWRLGPFFTVALWYARLAPDPQWLATYTQFEARASLIQMFDGQLVPVLLQTPDYARALVEAGRNDDVERILAARSARQEAIFRPDSPEIWVLLTENVLTWPVGGTDIMLAQLAYLRELSEQPNIVLRIVPRTSGASEALDGPFKIINVRNAEVGYIEAATGGRLVMDVNGARDLRSRFDRIGAKALPVDFTPEMIQRATEALSEQASVAEVQPIR
ncbi:helix-turn-helix domain-containing protein [Actinomadura algeriensis]|uniref:Transcriptional regulator with XRE-family HTH domain n=1 Tax=Actinomadura algeriensis TaxID=1679523 RepID=A0ABR9JL34_9ACTN|nr:helix-turn-helix transcriptional regulator [Actinomadura algeriensis]MBE1531091.1 transcriptional regulator with XRE-family HTH domain [Actinomadura algeriensis]